jgi:hypothetical protein
MAFPLPLDPDFRRAVVEFWLDDVDDRLESNRVRDAESSWKEASALYLSLPAGCGDSELEDRLFQQRVKLDQTLQITNADNL